VYQTAVLSKLLLVAEKGDLSQIQGKALDEITENINDIVEDKDEHNKDKFTEEVEDLSSIGQIDVPSVTSTIQSTVPCTNKSTSRPKRTA
jgi:hypothetical protein